MDDAPLVGHMNISGAGDPIRYEGTEPQVGPLPEPSVPLATRLGRGVRCHGFKIIVALLVITFLFLMVALLASFAETEAVEADARTAEADVSMLGALTSFANSIKHNGCKGDGGCGKGCPYIRSDDPRVAIGDLADSIERTFTKCGEARNAERTSTSIVVAGLPAASQESAATVITSIQSVCDKAYTNINSLMGKTKTLDSLHSGKDKVDVAVMNGKNCAIAYEAAASLNKHIFITGVLLIEAHLANLRLAAMANNTVRADNYDQYAAESAAQLAAMKNIFESVVPKILTDPKTGLSYDAIVANLDSGTDATAIVGAMSRLIQDAQDSLTAVNSMATRFDTIDKALRKCKVKDSFSNNLPGKLSNESISAMISNGDYSSALIQTALEADLVKNHQKFAKERSSFDSGGGIPSVRDDDNDVVPWVGLFGRASYRHTDGTSADTGSTPLRAIPSDNPDSLMRAKVPKISLI
jgi:hypothetical protein